MTLGQNHRDGSDSKTPWFEGETIQDVYSRLKQRFENLSGSLEHLVTRVIRPDQSLPNGASVDQEEVRETLRHLTMELHDVDFWFNHQTRISRFGPNKINQFHKLAEALAVKNQEVYGTFVIVDPDSDFAAEQFETPPPFFCMGQFSKTADNRLGITGIYRRQEMSSWWIVNIWELIEYRRQMIDLLDSQYGFTLTPTWVSTVAISAHWRRARKPMVAIPEFDQPSKEGYVGSLLAAVLEEDDPNATRDLASLLTKKVEHLSARNAPSLGARNLFSLLKLVESRFMERNEELYIELRDKLDSVLSLHETLRTGTEPRATITSLREAYKDVASMLRDRLSE